MMRFFVTAWIMVFLSCIVQAANTKPAYTIVLDRGRTVGEQYNIAVTTSDQVTRTVSSNGEVIDNKSIGVTTRLEGTVQVLEVDAHGGPIEESITISRCLMKMDGEEVSLAEKGTVVLAAVVDGEQRFSINGEPVSEELLIALDSAISLSYDDTSDDEVFGTKQPQHVGDSWNIDAGKFAESLANMGLTVAPEDITGKTTLKKALKVNGRQCLQIALQMHINNLKPADVPPEITVVSSTGTFSASAIYPVDPSQGPIEEQETMTMQTVTEGTPDPDGPLITIKGTMKHTVTTKYSKASKNVEPSSVWQ